MRMSPGVRASNCTCMMTSSSSLRAPAAVASEFHLFAAPPPGSSAAGSSSLPPLVVPPGVSALSCMGSDAPALTSPASLSDAPLLRLEPLLSRPSEPRLLLASSARCHASVNGLPAPRLVLLVDGDRFHFDAGPVFRVALFHRPRLGPAPSEVVGLSCPVCTLPLAEGDRCLVCACGTPLHYADDESREGALVCATVVTHCPHCQQPVRRTPGYRELSQSAHD